MIVTAHVAKGCLPFAAAGHILQPDWLTGTSDSLLSVDAPCLPLFKARPVCAAESTKTWLFLKEIICFLGLSKV